MMKSHFVFIFSFFLFIASSGKSMAQSDSLGMLGDELDLYGVLDLFKNSDNLEEFEKKLNSEDNHVNNLDLNNDDKIDYIRVVDYKEGNGHAIVLQVPINDSESQDVAVIEVNKTADGVAHVQIIGDEDLYGKNYIVEPLDETSSNTVSNNNTPVVVNVWAWRPVHYFYGPSYNVWVSPWRWSYYPGWYRPWRPVGWNVYYPRVVRYRPYGRVVVVRRSPGIYTNVYAPRRVTSKVVITNRTHTNYYNTNPAPKTNTGGNGVNPGREKNSQGNGGTNTGRGNNTPKENTENKNTGNNYNEGREDQRQENNQNVNTNKEQKSERKQRSPEANPSGGQGQRQQGRQGGGNSNHEHKGGGGGGKRGRK